MWKYNMLIFYWENWKNWKTYLLSNVLNKWLSVHSLNRQLIPKKIPGGSDSDNIHNMRVFVIIILNGTQGEFHLATHPLTLPVCGTKARGANGIVSDEH